MIYDKTANISMDLKEYCYSLSKDKLSELAIKLCDKAYPIWKNYCNTNSLAYQDTVVGELHVIEKDLLIDTLNLCRNLQMTPQLFKSDIETLLEKFQEPIIALDDEDWILPHPVKKVFYAIHNLLDGFRQQKSVFGELLHYVAINQSGDALNEAGFMTLDEIKKLVYG